jgi:hypothetical protein
MKPTPILNFLLLLFTIHTAIGQIAVDDPEIRKMITEVKSENMEATVKKLVSFGTRHTLSDTKSSTRGIGAAQRWVKSEFDNYALASNGRLTSIIDYYY